MRVCRSLGYLLSAGFSLAELLTTTRVVVNTDPTITAAPEIPMELLFRKQNNDRFIGWNSFSGSWYSQTCSVGGTYYQAGDYWRCCSTTSNGCNVPIGCFAGNLIYRVTTSGTQTSTLRTIPCSSFYDRTDSICNTGLLYENSAAAGADARTNIACGPSPLNFSFYRVRPSDTSSSTSSRSSATPQSNSASTTSAGTSASSTDSPAADSPAPKKKKGGSKAWIAGAVAGPIIGLALLGALLFFCLRRKKKNKTLAPASGPMQQQQQPTSQFNNSSTVPSYPASPNPAPAYYDTQQKQTALPYSAASVPGAPSPLQSHGPYAPPPPPLSPLSQQQQQQQQWQQYPQQGQNIYPSSPPPPPSTGSLSPQQQQQQQPVWNSQPYGRQSEVEARPFSAELDGSGAGGGGYQGVGGAAANR